MPDEPEAGEDDGLNLDELEADDGEEKKEQPSEGNSKFKRKGTMSG